MISSNMSGVLAIALFATAVGALQIGIAEEGWSGKTEMQCASNRDAVVVPFNPDEIRRPQPDTQAELHAIERREEPRRRVGQ